jgi:serine/tyrosine/threonine adenylyltransferase
MNAPGVPPVMPNLGFQHTYVTLSDMLYAPAVPQQAANPRLIAFNDALAHLLGLSVEALKSVAAEVFSGNSLPPDAQPLALAYAGHQFGHFVPQLGDGRAILLGEVLCQDGLRRDVQLKGAGRTVFSRGGDGRAALGPVLREYLVSEAVHALGIPTTRSLAAVATGEPVYREDELPGAVLTRVAASHVRVGTFQYVATRGDVAALLQLTTYVLNRHYGDAADAPTPAAALLAAVIDRQAQLVARWMHIGFIHGVMNTDNMSIAGETIDYGPCAFMDHYDPQTVFSFIDRHGRYAFGNQPTIAQWNLARLAEALLPLIDEDPAQAIPQATELVQTFSERFQHYWLTGMRQKLGLTTPDPADLALVQELLDAMHGAEADYTLTFRRLGDAHAHASPPEAVLALFAAAPDALQAWWPRWQVRLAQEPAENPETRRAAMHAVNPAMIPRNHLVEAALAAAFNGDETPFWQLFTALQDPYTEPPQAHYTEVPPRVCGYNTFCGT